jgi:hypothetical protein
MAMGRASILVGKCYQDSFGVVYRVAGYDGNEVRCVIYDMTVPGKPVEREQSEAWRVFLEDLQGEVDCPQL